MKPTLLLLSLVVSTTLLAQDWTEKHLQKLYSKNPDKCLERSEWLTDRFPKAAGPHFYSGRIRLEQLPKARNLKARYTSLSKAIGSARHFEKTASSSTQSYYAWPGFLQRLNDSCAAVAKELKLEHETAMYKKLVTAWDKFSDGRTELAAIDYKPAAEDKTAAETKTATAPKTETAAVVSPKGLFFGMPGGTENLPVVDLAAEKAVLVMINKERKRLKMDTLVWNDDLARACRYHANDMAAQGYFDHDTHDLVNGKEVRVGDTFERIAKFYSRTFVNSENIAAGNSTAAATYQQWYDSPGHYANMFNKSSKKAAIGMAKDPDSPWGYYWVFCSAE